MPSQHTYFRRVWNLIQACDVQSSDYKVYISTPPSPEVENFQIEIYHPARDRTPDLLDQRQTCYHLSQHGEQSRNVTAWRMIIYTQQSFLYKNKTVMPALLAHFIFKIKTLLKGVEICQSYKKSVLSKGNKVVPKQWKLWGAFKKKQAGGLGRETSTCMSEVLALAVEALVPLQHKAGNGSLLKFPGLHC